MQITILQHATDLSVSNMKLMISSDLPHVDMGSLMKRYWSDMRGIGVETEQLYYIRSVWKFSYRL
jgi:hypothetical protein